MAVMIRLSRIGKKNRPYWRVIAVDSRKKRDGAYLDNLGTYDPVKHRALQLNKEKIQEWVKQGAICSNAVIKLLKAKAPVSAQNV
jgi:small subunit ribosomal protein S16